MRIAWAIRGGIALLSCSFAFAQKPAAFPEIKDWNSLRMGLKRGDCFGSCPEYSVEVHGDGTVEFDGEANVLIPGRHHAQISKQLVRDLLAYFEDAAFFSLNNRYVAMITDHPTYTTSIEFDGQGKSVEDYVGEAVGMPKSVEEIERAVDEFAGTEKWVKGNDQTGPALLAEKWDFRADTEENHILFASVAAHGSKELIQFFIAHGASASAMYQRRHEKE